MELTFHGHACVSLRTQGVQFLFDPFITGNPLTDLDVETVHPDWIILTHAHRDHFGDTLELVHRTGCGVICNADIADYLEQKGVKKILDLHMGGMDHIANIEVELTPAWHGSQLVDGEQIYNFGSANGVLVRAQGKTLYHAGDTALFSDMKLMGRKTPIDVALLPIGDHYTMGPEDAACAVSLLGCRYVVPIHYRTFPVLVQSPETFIRAVAERAEVVVLEPGDSMIIS